MLEYLLGSTRKLRYYVGGGVFSNALLRDAIEAQATDVFVVELKPKNKELYIEEIQPR